MIDQPEEKTVEIKTNGTEIAMLLRVQEWHKFRQQDIQTIIDAAEVGRTMNLGGVDFLLNTDEKARAFKIGVLCAAGVFGQLPFTLTEIPNEPTAEEIERDRLEAERQDREEAEYREAEAREFENGNE